MARLPGRRAGIGARIVRGPEELDRLAQITPADVEAARVAVESAAPGLAALLAAERMEADGDTAQPADRSVRVE